MRRLIVFLFGSTVLLAQPISIGVKGGVPLTDLIDTASGTNAKLNSETKRYIAGATAELRLPAGFGVEVDALFRRFHYDSNTTLLGAAANIFTKGNEWEFPVLVKKRFGGELVRPYVAAGVSFNRISGLTQSVSTLVNAVTTTSSPGELKDDLSTGIVIGGGLEIRALLLKISPEIRYTRWGKRHFSAIFAPGATLNSNLNQAEFLVGITF